MDTTNTAKQVLVRSLRSALTLKKRRDEPAWARILAAFLLVLAAATVLFMVSVFLMAKPYFHWWVESVANNFLLGAVAGCTMLAMLRLVEKLLPVRAIDALAAMKDWRPAALTSVLLLIGMVLGTRLAYLMFNHIYDLDVWTKLSHTPLVQLKLLIFAVLVAVANWLWWLLQAKDRALAHQATESQLRMLQAQIEPHFLFNTLANVQSLIRSDPERAQLMLESFTDYLRASMVQMRDSDITLGVELETVRSYLQLMQIRMGRRLQFFIDADAGACRATLPPLLVQPLVENAVRHGLEGKVDGGSVRLSAQVHEGRLEIRVDDDGLGLAPARDGVRAGAGMALQNIRARLQTRYGSAACLRIEPLDQGARALLTVPYRPGAVPQAAQASHELARPMPTA